QAGKVTPSTCFWRRFVLQHIDHALAHRAETPLHLPACGDSLITVGYFDVCPSQGRASRNVLLEADVVREADRQCTHPDAIGSPHRAAPYHVAAFAIELLAGAQIALGNGRNIGPE